MSALFLRAITVAAVLLLTACAPSSAPTSSSGGSSAGQSTPNAPAPNRTLRLVVRAEPASVAGTILIPTGITTGSQRRVFNAGLALQDGESRFRPYLAESIPTLNTDSWIVNADGTMMTTWKLKPDLTWHDGQPLTADDFVFAWQVYTSPSFGISKSLPHSLMEDVSSPDARTVVIRWRQPYPDAAELDEQEFAPLPAHLLKSVYAQEGENLPNQPFWTTDYVGAGPYRVDRWEAGAFIDAAAFAGHVLGSPKIERLHITWGADFNANLATLLAGEADMPADDSIRVEQGLVLEQEWNARHAGTVQYRPTLPRFIQVQHRAEYANPQAVRDVRVRRALASAMDKQLINQTLFGGKGITSDSLIYPTLDYYLQVEKAVAKYPYDVRRAEQLMQDAGFARDAEGFWTSSSESRLNFEVRNIQSAQNDAERSIIADNWRRAGFEVTEDVFTPSQTRDGQVLGTFRSLSITSAAAVKEGLNLEDYTCERVSRPETRWFGTNRGGWCNAAYDRLINSFVSALDPDLRHQLVAQADQVLTEDLGIIPLHFNPGVIAYTAGLTGLNVKTPDSDVSWNIYEWVLH
jgi:peptide/nickel transport system substrate-binding protein